MKRHAVLDWRQMHILMKSATRYDFKSATYYCVKPAWNYDRNPPPHIIQNSKGHMVTIFGRTFVEWLVGYG